MATIDDFGGSGQALNDPPLGGPDGWAKAVRDAIRVLQQGLPDLAFEVVGLPAGEDPTVDVATVDGVTTVTIGVPDGIQGDPAQDPAFTFEVMTLPTGSSATIEVTGTYPALHVALGLPTGAQGPIGSGGPMSNLIVVDTTKQNAVIVAGLDNAVTTVAERATNPMSSHVEGFSTESQNWYGHAEGGGSLAEGKISHAEGNNSICSGNDSHAEGNLTGAGRRVWAVATTGSEDAGSGLGVLQYFTLATAEGDVTSHFPNPLTDNVTTRYGAGAQLDAQGNVYASGLTPAVWSGATVTTPNDLRWALHPYAILRGSDESEHTFVKIAKAVYASSATKVYYYGAKPFSSLTWAYGSYAPGLLGAGNGIHVEGLRSNAAGYGAHGEGYRTRAWGLGAHSEGRETLASADHTHAEGYFSKATANSAHAEGYVTTASGARSHAEGDSTTASGQGSHAEGSSATASGAASHAEGGTTTASGDYSHAEGAATTAAGVYSQASGYQSIASRNYQQAYSAGRRLANGDSQVSRIGYSKTCPNAGWHDIHVFNAVENNRTYLWETTVIGRQTAGTAGAVGNTFAYKFTGAVSIDGAGAGTTLGTVSRTLIGRTAGMTGDGLTTGPRMSALAAALYNADIAIRFDGEADTTFYIVTYSVVQELA